jgi:hypothetical protein
MIMKLGRTLSEVAAEIERQARTKQDYIADTRQLHLAEDGQTLALDGHGHFQTRDLALTQIGAHTGIPVPYMRRLQSEAPELLARNVNHWFGSKPAQRLVRTLDGGARAFLSNRYARIDNLEVAETVLPVLGQVAERHGGVEIVSTEVTENRLYIKAVFPQFRAEIASRRVGDIVEAGILISNSEVGLGAVSVKPFARFLACLNGMTRDGGSAWKHVGRRADESKEIYALLTDEAKAADDKALLLKVRDTVAATLDRNRFDAWTRKIQSTTGEAIEGDVPAAVEVLAKTLSLRQDEKSSVLRHLIEGADLSRFGLMNAVTRAAEDVESYDRATELEALGGAVVDLSPKDWQLIATAKPLALAA